MKRSEINAAIEHAKGLLVKYRISLPQFGYLTLDGWRRGGVDHSRIAETMLGWDVTDFGSGDFARVGATLFTLRNGVVGKPGVGTPYAEKYIIMDGRGQEIPFHYHIKKTEDIINRAGAKLVIQVYNAAPDNTLDLCSRPELWLDGVLRRFDPGELIALEPGQSITLTPYIYHRFYSEGGDTVAGEVSSVNDDHTDNIFLNPTERFTGIDEDEPIIHLLVNEYRLI